MSLTTTSRTTYICMSVRGGIRHLQGLRKNAKTYMNDDQGRALSCDEAINAMMDELAKGRETIPMGPHCANPCPNADKGCPGFDYGAGGGCGGFRTEPALPAAQAATDKPLTRCAAARDGDCLHKQCPQLRDNEPRTTGRHCPLDTESED